MSWNFDNSVSKMLESKMYYFGLLASSPMAYFFFFIFYQSANRKAGISATIGIIFDQSISDSHTVTSYLSRSKVEAYIDIQVPRP